MSHFSAISFLTPPDVNAILCRKSTKYFKTKNGRSVPNSNKRKSNMKNGKRSIDAIFGLAGIAAMMFLLMLPLKAATQDSGETRSGKEIYMSACTACHGADGKGQSQSRVGFDLPLPDFTDCNFSTREPDADWTAIVHMGGPVRGFSQIMPAFGSVLSMEEIAKAVGYVRTFCPDNNWPRGDLNLPRPMITEKAFPEDEAVINFGVGEKLDSISGEFVYEQRFGARNQIEFVVPFGWRERPAPGGNGAAEGWTSNLGDVAFGMKRTLFHNSKSGYIFSAAGEIIIPTGDEGAGFGKGTFVFEPFFSFGQIIPQDFFLHSQLGFEFPFKSSKAKSEAFLRLVLGRTFTTGGWWGRAWSPMIEVLASREFVSGEDIVLDIMPEIQVTLSTRQHIMLNVGVRIPVTETSNRSLQVMVYLLWDWFDGGFFEGW
jgi:mono/diheme cytochrome c family protein